MKTFNQLVPSVVLASAMLATTAFAQEISISVPDEIVIRGTRIPDEKKATSEIAALLNADDFERTGDADIASALARVTGLSITDGRFVVVRGLNERYSSATLNGLPLPSPEPLRRAVPLDLFPTSVLESSLVQKTFSPQFSGEFGGGLVELRTKSIPEENFLTVGVGISANTVTTFNDGLFYEGSDTDVLGFDDGLRDIPADATALFSGVAVTSDVQNAADTSFDQLDTLLIEEDDTPIDGSASLTLGRRLHEGDDLRIGTILYVSYDNDFQTREGNRFRNDGVNSTDGSFNQTRQEVSVSALSSTGFEIGDDHEIALTGLLVRKSLKTAEIATEFNGGEDATFLLESIDFIERQLWQTQLTGEHFFVALGDLGVEWQLGYGEATRDAPYDRTTAFRRDETTGDFVFTTDGNQNVIDFRFLKDENIAGGVDFNYPLEAFGTVADLSFGGDYTETNRETARRLFQFRGNFPAEIINSRSDLIFSDEILGLDGPLLTFASTSGEPDNFIGSLEVFAAYAAADIELGPYVRAAIGARFEEGTQEISTFVTDTPDVISAFDPIEEDYVLPALTVTWNPVGNFQLRVGASQTITRPQFRELSPSIFTDPDLDVSYVGNPFLVNSEIDNFDARAEYYFGRGEFVTLGLFYKDITNPIEDAIVTQGEALRTTFVNAPSAELYGVEFEFEKNFYLEDWFGYDGFAAGKELVFKTNYTYSQSEVDNVGTIVVPNISAQAITAEERTADSNIRSGTSLVGQSDHLFNLQLGIEQQDGAKATLLLNYSSERTLFRGTPTSGGRFEPGVIEQPPITLDFVVNQPLQDGKYNLTVKMQNLLGEEFDTYYEEIEGGTLVGEPTFQGYDLGRTVSVGLTRDF